MSKGKRIRQNRPEGWRQEKEERRANRRGGGRFRNRSKYNPNVCQTERLAEGGIVEPG